MPSSKYAGLGVGVAHETRATPDAGQQSARSPVPQVALAIVDPQRIAQGDTHERASLRPVQYGGGTELGSDVRVVRSSHQGAPRYKQPLELGNPGVTASLWRESQSGNEPFRDFRAWQPMDLVTIIVTEQ